MIVVLNYMFETLCGRVGLNLAFYLLLLEFNDISIELYVLLFAFFQCCILTYLCFLTVCVGNYIVRGVLTII